MPVITTHSSNHYGPHHSGKTDPADDSERNHRFSIADLWRWVARPRLAFVEDHCEVLRLVLRAGEAGETYNVGAGIEKTNIEVVHAICDVLDNRKPRATGGSYRDQITFVEDRPGHDRRYALDTSKIFDSVGWRPQVRFEEGLSKTIDWYLSHQGWVKRLISRTALAAGHGCH